MLPRDATRFVVRQSGADQALRQWKFCYKLTARQTREVVSEGAHQSPACARRVWANTGGFPFQSICRLGCSSRRQDADCFPKDSCAFIFTARTGDFSAKKNPSEYMAHYQARQDAKFGCWLHSMALKLLLLNWKKRTKTSSLTGTRTFSLQFSRGVAVISEGEDSSPERQERDHGQENEESKMAIELRSLPRFTFPSHSGGPQSRALTVGFPTAVRSAVAAINGFRIGFTSSDHELFQKESMLLCCQPAASRAPKPSARVNFALRDKCGVFDDPHEGLVDGVLIVVAISDLMKHERATQKRIPIIEKESKTAIELRSLPRFIFSSQSGGPQSQVQTVGFPTVVRSAAAAINGFRIGFTSADHNLFREEVDASATLTSGGLGVSVRVNFALRDKSGVFDDPYEGFVDVVLIVDRQ